MHIIFFKFLTRKISFKKIITQNKKKTVMS